MVEKNYIMKFVLKDQCDQMLEYEVAQIFQMLPIKRLNIFYLKINVLKISQNVNKYLGYFCNKIYNQELSKIARSGHTV